MKKETGEEVGDRIRHAFRLALLRAPAPDEVAELLPAVEEHGLAVLGRALFNRSELLILP